jgi:hypothetical protein
MYPTLAVRRPQNIGKLLKSLLNSAAGRVIHAA